MPEMAVGLISGMTRADFLWKLAGYDGTVLARCCRRMTIDHCYQNVDEKDILIGHSAGGIVAKMAVVYGGMRPKKVITIATPHQLPNWALNHGLSPFPPWLNLSKLDEEWPEDVELINIFATLDPICPPQWSWCVKASKNIPVLSGHVTAMKAAKQIIDSIIL